MKIYYYVNTGHRVGLDRLRRSAPVIVALQESGADVTLLTNDFRAGEYAKEWWGIRKYVSVDVVRNIANVARPGDFLVFDSAEESRAMWEEMADYFRGFIRFSDDPDDFVTKETAMVSSMKEGERIRKADIVDPRYFETSSHEGGSVYFWGDDDYEKRLFELADAFAGLDVALLEGYYFFVQYGAELGKKFARIEESEAYDEILKGATRFLTSSPQSALEALAAGSAPLYIKKPGISSAWSAKLSEAGVPVLESFDHNEISLKLAETPVYRNESLRKDAAEGIAGYIKDNFS